ncbi:MAG TPA: hypothetical protein VGO30_08225 [Mycobacterium sp.]|nr:hypothetical protein [Mycobacterium sp.]
MEASIRPWFTTGVALVGAGAIALAPITPSAPAMDVRTATAAVSREFQLTALDIPYILTLPIVRQQISNWVENWTVYLGGLAKAGVGLADSLLAIPGVTVEIVQEVLALNFVGAFDTFASAARDAVIAVGQPLLDSLIWRNQKYYAVQTALYAAVPLALIDVVNGFLLAGNGVTTALIQGTQDFIGAVLTFNLSNIIAAAVDGTRNFIVALGAGAGAIVSGIESAQFGIATALATEPPPAAVANVSALRTLAVERTLSLGAASSADTVDAVAPTQVQPATSDVTVLVDSALVDSAPSLAETTSAAIADAITPSQEATTGEADVVATGADVEPQDPLKAPAVTDASPSSDISHDATEPAALPKKPVDATPVKVAPKEVDTTVKKVTAGVEKDAGAKDGIGANDAGADAKSASASDDK